MVMTLLFLLAAISIVSGYKSNDGFVSDEMNGSDSDYVEFISADITTVIINGYSGNTINVYYDSGSFETVVKAVDGMFYLSANSKVIRRITLETGLNIVVGRKVDGDVISLKISENNLILRDAVNGYIPVGTYSEFQLINTDAVTRAGVYRQEADLDLLNLEWTPIGLVGTFDGNNHTLANLKISGNSDYVGLFGVIGTFTDKNIIRNVHVISGTVSGGDCVGGVCGYSFKSSIINCSNASSVSGHFGVGGICGASDSVAITACYNTSSVSGKFDVGGICGGGDSVVITACYNTGMISGNSGIGGICGHSRSIIACYNTGSVSGNSGVGGVCNYASSSITACYNTGMISGNSKVGGIYGGKSSSSSISACYWKDMSNAAADYDTGSPANNTGTSIFGITAWPAIATDIEWGTGDGSGSGKYWKSLGGWNGGNPVYPTLFFE
jgi:hypothetical protein